MTRFDRRAYLDRVVKLSSAMLDAQRQFGIVIGKGEGGFDVASAAINVAHRAFLDALYDELPRELDGVEVREKAA